MKSLAIVFFAAAAASPFVYWFFIRRSDSRTEREREERTPAPDKIISDPGRATRFEVEAWPDRSLQQQQEVEKAGNIYGESKRSHTSGPEPIACLCTEPELENSTYPEVEALAALGSIGEPAPAAVLERADQMPLAERSHVSELEPTAPLRTKSEQEDSSYPQLEALAVYGGIGEPAPDSVLERANQLPLAGIGQGASVSLTQPIQEHGNAATVLELSDISASGSTQVIEADVIAEVDAADPQLQADGPLATSAETSIPFHTEQLPQTNVGSGDGELAEPAEDFERGAQKALSRYRPPVQKPPRQITRRAVDRAVARMGSSEATFEIRVRLTLDRFGFCALTFLPGRTTGLDDEVAVKLGRTSLGLIAQEDWYQDLSFSDSGQYLRSGFELNGILSDQRRARWLLKGRDVYVLAAHPRASGFVSTTRLILGRSDILLCVTELVEAVEAILKEAGCKGYSRLDEALGLPQGWAGFRAVCPVRAVPLDVGTSDRFYAIKPAADIEIEFEGGIWLRNSVWLAGYPPQIKLFGQTNDGTEVLIDGKKAQFTAQGSLVVDGYDLPGPHSVYCEGLSRSYSIEEAPDSWEAWPAHQFGGAAICGASVQLPPEKWGSKAFTVPMSNPLLIGAEPGQIFRCSSRSVAVWRGFVPFEVVWALPAQPLMCNKKTTRILQFSDNPVMPRRAGTRQLAWCNAILDASRKGLRIEGGSAECAVRWAEYKRTARSIWRSRR